MKLYLQFCLGGLLKSEQFLFVQYIENESYSIKSHDYHFISSLKTKFKHTQMKYQWIFHCLVHVIARKVLI